MTYDELVILGVCVNVLVSLAWLVRVRNTIWAEATPETRKQLLVGLGAISLFPFAIPVVFSGLYIQVYFDA